MTLRGVVVATTVFLAGCYVPRAPEIVDFTQRANTMQPGMTQEEVMAIMGPYKNRQFHGPQVALQWCETSPYEKSADAFLVGIFHQGRLISTSTYQNHRRGPCEGFFRQVEWVRPSHIIDYRAK